MHSWSDGVAQMRQRVRRGVETGPRLLEMEQRGGELSQTMQRLAERLMRRDEQRRISLLLGLTQELMAQIAGRLERALPAVEMPESPHRGEQMGRLAHLPAQFQGPGIRGPHPGRSVTFCSDEQFAQRDQKLEFLSGRLHVIGEGARELQTPSQMSDRLQIG